MMQQAVNVFDSVQVPAKGAKGVVFQSTEEKNQHRPKEPEQPLVPDRVCH